MSSAFRRVLIAAIIIGGSSAVATLATVKPIAQDIPPSLHALSRTSLHSPHHRLHPSTPRSLLSGLGSWYGDMFDGRATASGEIFDQEALTACHPTLPFGTLVKVINLRNRRSVVVRINDRGIRADRIIDLSSAAAEKIGMLETGVTPVKLVILPNSST